ncbi:hypothetical protein [Streptomyces sp. NBC_00258]|uniref:hypothetical protein n=1 Tax=Streptomyces sp. NBC_00258 TaxID=2903642 RepID=UPI002E2CDD19|nr:hypothetical protein [Streptomyces sp. NBC_00258]
MTDHAYTTADLLAEAARQHKTATEDPDFSGIGEQMEGHKIPSRDDFQWDQLDEDDFDKAHRAIDDLLGKAADVSRWAVELGADGLEPEDHQFTLNAGPTPIIRVHFGFAPGLGDEGRDAFVEGLGAAAAREMSLALEENPEPTIGAEAAAHVLFQERLGGWPPSTFASKLLDLWTSADTTHAEHLEDAFPEYAAAIALVKKGQPGIEQLRAIADRT